jgi:hypothetical protein
VCPFLANIESGSLRSAPFIWGPTSSIYRPRRGSVSGGFLKKESSGDGKTECSILGSHVHSWAPRSPGCLVFFIVDVAGSVGPERHHSSYADP